MASATATPPRTNTASATTGAPTVSSSVDAATLAAFESLDKWKNCTSSTTTKIPARLVYKHNRVKAANKGFPSVLQVGKTRGLTDHEVTALYGWTTGDYRMVNPIARGLEISEFDDYPLLPQDMTKHKFKVTREEVLPYIQIFKSALSKLPTDGQRVWRGHKRPLPTAIGSTFCLEGFASATLDRGTALEFCTKTDGGTTTSTTHPKQRTLICFLKSQSGKSISKFSCRPQELEVVFLPDTQFQVVNAPEEESGDDQKAVQTAIEGLQKELPEATIHLLYVEEVTTKRDEGFE